MQLEIPDSALTGDSLNVKHEFGYNLRLDDRDFRPRRVLSIIIDIIFISLWETIKDKVGIM